jgi:ACR3 family arsenite transporter
MTHHHQETESGNLDRRLWASAALNLGITLVEIAGGLWAGSLALLATLVLIFGFQADNITSRFFHVVLIAVPILIQVYFNASLAYGLMKLLGVQYSVAAPGALIGASNFFELAVATAIALFGPGSGAALATVVGVLIEVPVMLSVCSVCNRTRHWFALAEARE